MELEDENRGDLSFLCDVTAYFSDPHAWMWNWKDTNRAFMNMHAAVKGNSNESAFTGRDKLQQEKCKFRTRFTNLDSHKQFWKFYKSICSWVAESYSETLTHRAELIAVEQPSEGQVWFSWGKRVCPFHLRHNATILPWGCLRARHVWKHLFV